MTVATTKAAEGKIATVAVNALKQILEVSADDMPPEDLRVVARLKKVFQIQYKDTGSEYGLYWYEEKVDCSQVRQLARQELKRRGLEA